MASNRKIGNELMADISDVEDAIANAATTIIYPMGAAQGSIAGVTCRIYRGWPNSATLAADLNAGVVNVTVASDNNTGHTTTRYLPDWQYRFSTPSLSASVSGQTITLGGTASVGNVVGVLIDGTAYAYRVAEGDTPPLVASNLCAQLQLTRIATVHGSSINVPGAGSIIARAVCDTYAESEGRRQEKDVRMIFWCPSPIVRDIISSAVDQGMCQESFLTLADNTQARIQYRNSATYDQSQNALLYRRDLIYSIEYATIVTGNLPSMLFGSAAINGRPNFG